MDKKESRRAKEETTRYWRLEGGGKTEVDTVSAEAVADIAEAAQLLRSGGTVAFPTETVYGLGADARNAEAVQAVFAAKGRPSDNPLIVHIADEGGLDELVADVHPLAARLMEVFWPGPLTLVLPLKPGALPPVVTAGLDTVGIRVPEHPAARALIAAAGCPVAAPSANRSGRPSPTLASHVLEDLAGAIGGVLDGGPAGVGLESTVVEVLGDGAVAVLRPGGVTAEQLEDVAGLGAVVAGADAASGNHADPAAARAAEKGAAEEAAAETATSGGIDVADVPGGSSGASKAPDNPDAPSAPDAPGASGAPGETEAPASQRAGAPRSPGMKYAHYAPRGRLSIVRGPSPQKAAAAATLLLRDAGEAGEKTGLLLFEEHRELYPVHAADCLVSLGSVGLPEQAASVLYAALRQFDEAGVTYILAEACPEQGLGAAVMNRLVKAAAGRFVDATAE